MIRISDSTEAIKKADAASSESYQEFVFHLVTLEHNVLLYPPEHKSIQKATEGLQKLLETLFNQTKSLKLLATQDRLVLNGQRLVVENPRNRKLAQFLSQRGIVSMTLETGLTPQELARVFVILHKLPPRTDIQQFPELYRELNALSHISVTLFELKGLRVQDRERVEAPAEDELQGSRMAQLMEYGIGDGDNDDSLDALNELLPELAPQLLERTATQHNSSGKRDNDTLTANLRSLIPDDMLLAFSMQALNNNRQISPMLQKLLSTFSQVNSSGDHPPLKAGAIGAEALQKLFERERYEEYVSPDYDNQLNTLGRQKNMVAATAGALEGIPGVQSEDLSSEQIDRRLVMALLGLMHAPYEDKFYHCFSEQLELIITEFQERKCYDLLSTIFEALKPLETDTKPPAAQEARRLLERFSDSAFISRLKRDFASTAEDTHDKPDGLILSLGPKNIPWLLESYMQTRDNMQRTRVLRLLLQFKTATADAVLDQLSFLDHTTIKPFLRLVVLCGGDPADARLYPLLDAPDQEVRLEVMRMFLSVGSTAPITRLVKMIRSRSEEAALLGIRIAGEYKVRRLAVELTSKLKTTHISASSARLNRAILENLSCIGEDTSLPSLLKLAKAWFSLTPGRLQTTQEELFINIGGYSDRVFRALLDIGIESKNPVIRQAVQQYMRPADKTVTADTDKQGW